MAYFTFRRAAIMATLITVLWTIARAAVVWKALEGYGVDPRIFLALDIITAPSYVWGIGKMFQGLRGVDPLKMVYIGGVVAIASFIAPYAYLYLVGYAMMPMSTKIIIGIIVIAIFVAGPLREVIKKVKIGKACDSS